MYMAEKKLKSINAVLAFSLIIQANFKINTKHVQVNKFWHLTFDSSKLPTLKK